MSRKNQVSTKDRQPEVKIGRLEDGRVVVARPETVDEIGQRGYTQSAPEMIVERRDGLPVEDGIVGELGSRRDRASTGDLEIDPFGGRFLPTQRCRESPRRACGSVPLADMGDPHRSSLSRVHGRQSVDGAVASTIARRSR